MQRNSFNIQSSYPFKSLVSGRHVIMISWLKSINPLKLVKYYDMQLNFQQFYFWFDFAMYSESAIRSCSGRSQLCFELELVCSLEFARPCVYRKHHHHCIWLPRTVHSADAAVRTGIKKLGESCYMKKNRERGKDWERDKREWEKEESDLPVLLLTAVFEAKSAERLNRPHFSR